MNEYNTKAGIYKITNIVNNKIYIGSSINLKYRKCSHFRNLRLNKHVNYHLQYAFNKYKEENFKWEVIEYVDIIEDKKELRKVILEREQYWIDSYKDKKCILYNICAIAGSSLGVSHTEETKNKKRGKNNPMYGKHSYWYGKKMPQEIIEKIVNIRRSNDSYKWTEEQKLNKSKARKGYKGIKHTEETKQKLRKINLGKKLTEETRNKISKIIKDRNANQEYRGKMSINAKNGKKVINLTTSKIYDNAGIAARYYNIDKSSISKVCRGERKSAGGYKWKFV